LENLLRKKAIMIGVAGSNKAFSLSLYNLKAYAYSDPEIRKNWDLKVLQYPLINYYVFEEKLKEHADLIQKEQPDLLALSCYMWNIQYFHLLAQKLKENMQELKIIVGGPEISREYILQGKLDNFSVDYCISGEGEQTFFELLQNETQEFSDLSLIYGLSYRESLSDSFIVNDKRAAFKSLLQIPSPYLTGVVDDEVLLREGVEANLETQRGCNLRCSYCVYHKDMARIAYSDIDRLINEVKFVINKGVKKIRFVDANFSSKLDHAKSVMRELVKNRFEVKVMFELIPGFIDEELVKLFNKFNNLYEWNELTLGIGVQTINMQVLKKIRRSIRLSKFETTFNLLQQYDIYAKIDLIIGLPGEDLASIERTLEYMLDKLQNSRSHLLCCHILRGLPGTELMEIAEEYNMEFTSEHEPHELFQSPVLPRVDMLKCLRRTAVIFRLVNHSGWAKKEFVFDTHSESVSVRDEFYKTRDHLNISNIGLIDLIIKGLMDYLPEDSQFVNDRFPFAETWWWTKSKREIKDRWIFKYLTSLCENPNSISTIIPKNETNFDSAQF
jgi:radical SAM superfamily enzyme YgiQ (UPF0313 family)